jgi:hypothetical protein
MRIQRLAACAFALAAAVSSCSSEDAPTAPKPPAPAVLLQDVVLSNLPSPYYHFEYDASGRVTSVSFASGLTMYEVEYDGGRISQLRNTTAANHDRLQYVYDGAGKVAEIQYVDATGATFTRVSFTYQGQQLTGLERTVKWSGGFVTDKTMALSYDSDGNVREIVEHRPAIEGRQSDATFVDRYEQYDDKINVDGFGLLHNDFFDHLVLLPAVQIQKGNPRRETRSGDGINFSVEYVYTYDARNRPLAKNGQLTILNGADAGRVIQTSSTFTYY